MSMTTNDGSMSAQAGGDICSCRLNKMLCIKTLSRTRASSHLYICIAHFPPSLTLWPVSFPSSLSLVLPPSPRIMAGSFLSSAVARNRIKVVNEVFAEELAKRRSIDDIDHDPKVWEERLRRCHPFEKPLGAEFKISRGAQARATQNPIRKWYYQGLNGQDDTPYALAARGTPRQPPAEVDILDVTIKGPKNHISLRDVIQLLGQYGAVFSINTAFSLPRNFRHTSEWLQILEKLPGPWYNLVVALDKLFKNFEGNEANHRLHDTRRIVPHTDTNLLQSESVGRLQYQNCSFGRH